MYLYKSFGINIESEVLIPQFTSTEDQSAEVSIRYGEVKTHLPNGDGFERAIQISEEEIGFYFEQVGSFLVRNGCEIVVDPYPGAEEQLIRLPLIGIVMAALLQQRGNLVLHASAVSVNDEAVVFLGWKGAGKSTTSAMMYGRGHTMISDDIVALENSEISVPLIVPAFPHFKLMPETAASILGDDADTLSRISTGFEKRFRSSSDNFLENKIPLQAIYLLEEGSHLQAETLQPQEAITTLIANTYLARYGKQLIQKNQAITNLRQCSKIVNHLPVYRLVRPKSLDLLGNLAKLIESQCEKNRR